MVDGVEMEQEPPMGAVDMEMDIIEGEKFLMKYGEKPWTMPIDQYDGGLSRKAVS